MGAGLKTSTVFLLARSVISELLHPLWPLGFWPAERLVEQVRLQDRVTREAEHAHEQHADEEALQQPNDYRRHPVLRQALVRGHIVKESVDYDSVGGSDEDDAEKLHDESNGASGAEGRCVLDHEEEAVPGGWAEGFAGQGDLKAKEKGIRMEINKYRIAQRAGEDCGKSEHLPECRRSLL